MFSKKLCEYKFVENWKFATLLVKRLIIVITKTNNNKLQETFENTGAESKNLHFVDIKASNVI